MKSKERSFEIKKTFSILIVFWFIIMGAFIVWAINNEKRSVYEYAANEARAGFEKDLLYRHWSTLHGGTYVPVTEHTPPNPYLNHIPERDILSPSGRKLTLVNPAYMTRQVHELGEKQYGTKGHITSLNPIRPENKPGDEWEVESLKSFENGTLEILAIKSLEGAEYLRLMRPLMVKKSCLKCHAKQGYAEGHIRGGISISVPLKPYKAVAIKNIRNLVIIFGVIGLLGMAGLFWGGLLMNRKELDKGIALKALKQSEERFREMADLLPGAIVEIDADLRITYVNRQGLKLFHYSEEDIAAGLNGLDLIHPDDKEKALKRVRNRLPEKDITATEYRVMKKNNESCWVFFNASPIYKTDQIIGFRLVLNDITALKQIEKERETLINELQGALAEIKTLKGIVPICSNCKKIRDDAGYWNILESYIQKHSDASFTHGICPDCSNELYGKEDWYVEMNQNKEKKDE